MIKYSTIFLTLLFLIVSFSPRPVAAASEKETGSISIQADSLTYEKSSDSYKAIGSVKLEWDDATLFADSALLNQGQNTAEAKGKVFLKRYNDTLRTEQLTLDIKSGKGVAKDGYLFMKQANVHLRGEKMEKEGDEDYHIDKGSFTFCDGEVPSWKFSASTLDVTLGEYASGKNVLFYIKDVPVLYLPYMLFPLRRERQSGFLIPVIGTSTITGTNVSVPFYWAISPSQDVTFNLKYMSKRGVGAGADYQYIRKTGSEGSFKGFLIYDTKQERFRGEFSERHQEAFSPSITFKSDFSYVSDRNYYRDFTETFGDYNRKSVDSNIFMTKRWQRFSLTPELRLSQNLEATSNADTLQKLPLITFTAVKQRFGAIPFYFSLDSNFTNFYRERGVSGQRVDLHPRATFYYTPVEEVETAAWVGFRSRLYNTGEGGNIAVFRESGLMDGGFTVSSTLARVYEIGWKDLRKVQHVIMPEVGYSYLAKGDQSSLPFFDYNDRVVAQNMATYSITNYLTGKFVSGDETSDYRTLAYLKLSQGYDFSGSRRDLLTAYQDLDPFSDIRIEAQIKPLKHLSFMTDSRYNPNRTNFSSTEVAVNVADDKGNLVSAGYHFTRTQFEYLEGKVSVALLKPFLLNFNGRYSVDSGSMLESYYSIEYKQQCWGIIFSYGERRGNRNFFVNFTMAGLGPLAKIKAF